MTTTMLMVLGGIFTVATGPRWGIAPLAWVAPVPFLLWARRARGWRAWSAIFAVLLIGFAVQCAVFATTPVPVIGVIGFAPPLALLRFGAIAVAEAVRRRSGEAAGLGAYVMATVTLDWVGYGASEFGAWMATANSQVEWLAFMQLVSVAGLAGPGALMAWAAGAMAGVIDTPEGESRRRLRALAVVGVVIAAVVGWGTYRLDRALPGRSVTVAAVTTQVGPTETGLPDEATLRANADALFERTRVAAAIGDAPVAIAFVVLVLLGGLAGRRRPTAPA